MNDTEILIVGAGSTGLFLSGLLRKNGIRHRIIDAATAPSAHSRSVGIHPVSFRLLEDIGVLDAIRAEAVSVRQGVAYDGRNPMGSLPLGEVLLVPQFRTEAILEQVAEPVERGIRFDGYRGGTDHVMADTSSGPIRCGWLVGADGMHSAVRRALGVEQTPRAYPHAFHMGDFLTDGADGGAAEAGIHLHADGMVESFPLGDRRRWVVMRGPADPDGENGLIRTVEARTGVRLRPEDQRMYSRFTAYRYLSPVMAHGRVVLVGDAAHVTSPIGGQGMNLGWLNAADLAGTWPDTHGYARRARRRAVAVIRRAEFNMAIGGRSAVHSLRVSAIRHILRTPIRNWLTTRFTMRNLP